MYFVIKLDRVKYVIFNICFTEYAFFRILSVKCTHTHTHTLGEWAAVFCITFREEQAIQYAPYIDKKPLLSVIQEAYVAVHWKVSAQALVLTSAGSNT